MFNEKIRPADISTNGGPAAGQWFTATHWSVVLAAKGGHSPQSAEALEKLCRTYWSPLYAFVRRQGHTPQDAQDLTQDFFAWLLQSEHLRLADPQSGKFRSFLLVRLKHFLSDERKKACAQKRGGGQTVLSLDAALAEEQYRLEPATDLTPDVIFDRRWALTVMEQAVQRLSQEYLAAGRAELFEELKSFQSGEEAGRSYAEAAARLGVSESAVKSAIWRLRQRHRDLLRQEIAQTVSTPGEVDEEIRYLINILGG
jgi:RNA polymerase sigma-70 factor (ECF subfamily)